MKEKGIHDIEADGYHFFCLTGALPDMIFMVVQPFFYFRKGYDFIKG
jgi:hypothetical protein